VTDVLVGVEEPELPVLLEPLEAVVPLEELLEVPEVPGELLVAALEDVDADEETVSALPVPPELQAPRPAPTMATSASCRNRCDRIPR